MKKLAVILLGFALTLTAPSHAQEYGVTAIDPPSLGRPEIYAMGTFAPAGAQVLVTAGQVGADKNGVYAEGIEAQADLAFKNLYDVITAAGMGPENVMKITMYYLDMEDFFTIIDARDKYFGEDFRPALTAIVVKSLANEQILVEVEAIAAK